MFDVFVRGKEVMRTLKPIFDIHVRWVMTTKLGKRIPLHVRIPIVVDVTDECLHMWSQFAFWRSTC
jgi:hypothetical protein